MKRCWTRRAASGRADSVRDARRSLLSIWWGLENALTGECVQSERLSNEVLNPLVPPSPILLEEEGRSRCSSLGFRSLPPRCSVTGVRDRPDPNGMSTVRRLGHSDIAGYIVSFSRLERVRHRVSFAQLALPLHIQRSESLSLRRLWIPGVQSVTTPLSGDRFRGLNLTAERLGCR